MASLLGRFISEKPEKAKAELKPPVDVGPRASLMRGDDSYEFKPVAKVASEAPKPAAVETPKTDAEMQKRLASIRY